MRSSAWSCRRLVLISSILRVLEMARADPPGSWIIWASACKQIRVDTSCTCCWGKASRIWFCIVIILSLFYYTTTCHVFNVVYLPHPFPDCSLLPSGSITHHCHSPVDPSPQTPNPLSAWHYRRSVARSPARQTACVPIQLDWHSATHARYRAARRRRLA